VWWVTVPQVPFSAAEVIECGDQLGSDDGFNVQRSTFSLHMMRKSARVVLTVNGHKSM
jgi:hypothetical protein